MNALRNESINRQGNPSQQCSPRLLKRIQKYLRTAHFLPFSYARIRRYHWMTCSSQFVSNQTCRKTYVLDCSTLRNIPNKIREQHRVPVRLNKEQVDAHVALCDICDNVDDELNDWSDSTLTTSWWEIISKTLGYPCVNHDSAGFTVCFFTIFGTIYN